MPFVLRLESCLLPCWRFASRESCLFQVGMGSFFFFYDFSIQVGVTIVRLKRFCWVIGSVWVFVLDI